MARLPPPVTMITCSIPLAIASSTPYWMVGLSTSGSISLGWALVTGRKRVPRPAAGKMALRTIEVVITDNLSVGDLGRHPSGTRGAIGARRRGRVDHPTRGRQGHVLDPGHDRSHGGCEPQSDQRPDPRRPDDGGVRSACSAPGAGRTREHCG